MHEWLIQLSHTIVKCVCQGMHISNVLNVPAAGFRSDPIFYTKPLVRSAWIAPFILHRIKTFSKRLMNKLFLLHVVKTRTNFPYFPLVGTRGFVSSSSFSLLIKNLFQICETTFAVPNTVSTDRNNLE